MKTILFNTEMTKAILDGRKTQFRVVIKETVQAFKEDNPQRLVFTGTDTEVIEIKPKYQIGDTLWVGEDYKIGGWYVHSASEKGYGFAIDHSCEPYDTSWHRPMTFGTFSDMLSEVHRELDDMNYPCSGAKREYTWDKFKSPLELMDKSSMEEWMARIFLKVTNIRVEKFEDTIEDDIIKEGIPLDLKGDEDGLFMWEWIELQYPNIEPDDYVFVYEFEKLEKQ
jgi:hypothetical protein